MFERFTEQARRTIFSAKYIAGQIGAPQIEQEHLLLGLLKEDQSLVPIALLGTPWALDEVWQQVSKTIPICERLDRPVDLKLSTLSKHTLTSASMEAARLHDGHNWYRAPATWTAVRGQIQCV